MDNRDPGTNEEQQEGDSTGGRWWEEGCESRSLKRDEWKMGGGKRRKLSGKCGFIMDKNWISSPFSRGIGRLKIDRRSWYSVAIITWTCRIAYYMKRWGLHQRELFQRFQNEFVKGLTRGNGHWGAGTQMKKIWGKSNIIYTLNLPKTVKNQG